MSMQQSVLGAWWFGILLMGVFLMYRIWRPRPKDVETRRKILEFHLAITVPVLAFILVFWPVTIPLIMLSDRLFGKGGGPDEPRGSEGT